MLLSSGSQTKIAAETAIAMAANANNGPASPSGANTNSGAVAGPMMVPRPNDEDSADNAATRPLRRVRDAR